jgi:hypothetical protein
MRRFPVLLVVLIAVIYLIVAVPFAFTGWATCGMGGMGVDTPMSTRCASAMAWGAGWPLIAAYLLYTMWSNRR